jgi:carbon monoxide dehydrogenase subunit G
MATYHQHIRASPERVWALLARPDRWAEWAPHLRGADGLGAPEVRAGASGAVRLLGVLPVPARITAKRDGRLWTWRVGPVTLRHRVDPAPGGEAEASIELIAPTLLEPALRVTYGPVIALLLRNLARVAERGR